MVAWNADVRTYACFAGQPPRRARDLLQADAGAGRARWCIVGAAADWSPGSRARL